MSVKTEELGKGKVQLTFVIEAAEFEAGCEKAYQDKKEDLDVPGFRRGKAPRRILEQTYGEEIFYEPGFNNAFPNAYSRAVAEAGIAPIEYPEIVDLDKPERNKDLTVTVTVTVKPEVKLGEYKGIRVSLPDTAVTEDDVQAELESMRKLHSRPGEKEDQPELPELNDAFISEVTEYETLAEYREFLHKQLCEQKEKDADEQIRSELIGQVIDGAEVDIPEKMIDEECEQQFEELRMSAAQMMGMSLTDYLSAIGKDEASLMAEFRPTAERNVKGRLVMDAIVKAEGLTVAEEEIAEEVRKMAEAYGMEPGALRESLGNVLDQLRDDLLRRNAMELVLNEAVIGQE